MKILLCKLKIISFICLLCAVSVVQAHQSDKIIASESGSKKLESIVKSEHRTAKFSKRDVFRHPFETLSFFGLKDNMTVVEISPGAGWYAEILAPFLKDNGQYIAAGYDPQSSNQYFQKKAKQLIDKLSANPKLYGKAKVSVMQVPEKLNFTQDNSADMVLSFRNTHNWHSKGHSEAVYGAIYKALKPGGIFGLVQHRAGHRFPLDKSGKMGYLKQSDIIRLAQKIGFQLLDKSDLNANPKDTRDYEAGVWTLPPVYRLNNLDRKKYEAIGESDRMTLKFVKPHAY